MYRRRYEDRRCQTARGRWHLPRLRALPFCEKREEVTDQELKQHIIDEMFTPVIKDMISARDYSDNLIVEIAINSDPLVKWKITISMVKK